MCIVYFTDVRDSDEIELIVLIAETEIDIPQNEQECLSGFIDELECFREVFAIEAVRQIFKDKRVLVEEGGFLFEILVQR